VARTQAIYYRDARGEEPVDDFINALPGKPAAKIDDSVEEHLNGRRPSDPPPEFPISSQVSGELRELRVRFADTRYRILYQTLWEPARAAPRLREDHGVNRRRRH
jgi:hypothetical protein